MRFKRNLIFPALTVMVTCLVFAQVFAQQPTMALNPSSVKDVASGQSFSVDVTIADVTNLFGWQANITFNPGVLNVENVTEGSFLKGFNETVWTKKIDNDNGYVQFQASYYPPYTGKKGANGSGVLATITFKAESGGSSALDFVEGTKLKSFAMGNVVNIEPFTSQDGSFTGTGGGFSLPFEVIAGVGAAVVIVVVAGVFFVLRRRKE